MSANSIVTESRQVSDFDRVALAGFGELVITQGDQETLTIEATQQLLSRIQTEVIDGKLILGVNRHWLDWISDFLNAGLNRMRVKYDLKVKQLTSLAILGAGRVRIANLKSENLGLELVGTGEVKIESLDAERVNVVLPGAGLIGIAGQVTDQKVILSGAGSYNAGKLASQKAEVTLEGLGSATVWAAEELDATIRGLGNVSYYGSPEVRKRIFGPGTITSLGNPE